MKSTFTHLSNELQRIDIKIGYLDNCPSNGRHDDMPYALSKNDIFIIASDNAFSLLQKQDVYFQNICRSHWRNKSLEWNFISLKAYSLSYHDLNQLSYIISKLQ